MSPRLSPRLIALCLVAVTLGGAIGLAGPVATAAIVRDLAPAGNLAGIALATAGLMAAGLAGAGLAYLGGIANQKLWLGWERRTMAGALIGLAEAPPAADLPPAAALERLRGAAQAREALAAAGLTAAGSAAVLLASGGYLVWLAPAVGALALGGLVLLSLAAAGMLRAQAFARIEAAEAESTATGFLSSALRVRLDGGGVPRELEAHWQHLHGARMRAARRAQFWRDGQRALDAATGALAPAGLIGAAAVLAPDLGPGGLAAVFAAFGQCLMAAFGLSWAAANLAQAREGVRMLGSLPAGRPGHPAGQPCVPSEPLAFDDVRFAYPGGKPLFDGLSFSLAAGASLAVTGPSGAGKSTLVRLAAGLLRPEAGVIRLCGRDPGTLAPHERQALVGAITSDIPDFGGTLVEEAGADAALDWAVDLTDDRRRQIALARAFAGNPRLLLLDEALGDADPALVDAVFARAARIGAAMLVVSHDPALVVRCARRLTLG